MNERQRFLHVRAGGDVAGQAAVTDLLARRLATVVELFEHFSGTPVIVSSTCSLSSGAPASGPGGPGLNTHVDADGTPRPHNEATFAEPCRGCTARGECMRHWPGHLAELRRTRQAHWQRCAARHLLGVVPLWWDGAIVAALRMVCDRQTEIPTFLKRLELLELLGWACSGWSAAQAGSGERRPQGDSPKARPVHPAVQEAIDVLDHSTTDASLSVTALARQLGINATYLGHLFRTQTGLTVRRYVAQRRIELAKRLLATTDWQVKRIAYETGHRTADWFSHVFREETGLTPLAYRRQSRKRSGEARNPHKRPGAS